MKLKTPIEVDGKTIAEVTLTEPTFDDLAELGTPSDASDTKERMAILKKYVARCTNLPEEAVGRLKLSDAIALLTKVGDFFTVAE